jgi:hypothetical protein
MGVKLSLSHEVKNIDRVWEKGTDENIWSNGGGGLKKTA